MSQEIQQLQAQLRDLKVRVFDAEETLKANGKSFSEVMQKLVETLQVQGDEQGNVSIDDIVARAAELVQTEVSAKDATQEYHDAVVEAAE
ncbi:MAG: hypothetical protein ACRCWQ_01950 [Bacilli bacterium]